MSINNLKILARNMRQEQERRIVYNNRASSWKTIFKHHPLESNKNELLFYNMAHCTDSLGAGDVSKNKIITLRTAYTWSNLIKISNNSLQDCITFYEVAKHTFLNNWSILQESNDKWFKKALTAIYLAKDNAPESMNFLSELSQEQKETTVSLAFQYFGTNVLPKYEKHEEELNIQNFNEKLIFWYWAVDVRENNLIDQVIDKLIETKKIVFDTEYLAEYFQPKQLLKPQSEQINKRFIPFKNIAVETKRYNAASLKIVCIMSEEFEKTSLENIYNLFCSQCLIKQLEIINEEIDQSLVLIGEVRKPDFASFLGEFKYSSVVDILNAYPLTKESRKSMEGFIELNRSNSKNISYWNDVQAVLLAHQLNDDLESNEKVKNKKLKV
jgi:hypothetical protein